jgi:hypothetical protein
MKSVTHNAAKSVNRSILKKIQHTGLGVFIVQSSMILSFAYPFICLSFPCVEDQERGKEPAILPGLGHGGGQMTASVSKIKRGPL